MTTCLAPSNKLLIPQMLGDDHWYDHFQLLFYHMEPLSNPSKMTLVEHVTFYLPLKEDVIFWL